MKPASKAQSRLLLAMHRSDGRLDLYAREDDHFCVINNTCMRCGRPTLRTLLENGWIRPLKTRAGISNTYKITIPGSYEAEYAESVG